MSFFLSLGITSHRHCQTNIKTKKLAELCAVCKMDNKRLILIESIDLKGQMFLLFSHTKAEQRKANT